MHRFKKSALARATHLHRTGLAAALLLPLCTDLHAHTAPAPQPVAHEQSALSGHFLNLKALNPKARNAGEIATDQLRQQTGLNIHSIEPAQEESFGDLKVMVGKTMARTRAGQAEDDFIIASRPDGSFVALIPQANAIIRGEKGGQQTLLRHDGVPLSEHSEDSIEGLTSPAPLQQESSTGLRSLQLERNASGDIVIDLLAGFSKKSAQYIGDPEAYALGQVISINRAILQSQIRGVRVRLVGVQVVAEDTAITTPALAQVKERFAEGIKQYSPDIVASFVRGVSGEDTAAGWGYVNGVYTLNQISGPTVFRHEIAHNIGGNHCSDGSSYRFGHNNGRVKTILCGNQIPYYSNPDLTDSQGVAIGNAQTANMARVWRENAAKMSAYAPAVVPMNGEQPTRLVAEALSLAKNEIRYFPLDIPVGTQRLLFTAVPGEGYESQKNVQFHLKKDQPPTSTDYDYVSHNSRIASLSVNNPAAGRWYLSLQAEKDTRAENLIVEAYAFAQKEETAKARYIRFVANSSIDGTPTASIAELHLADARGKSLPRNWQIHSATSAAANFPVGNILDGNTKSYWSTAPEAKYPHQLIIDLGQESQFSQLHYLPRQDQGQNGNIKAYQVFTGNSAEGPWTLAAEGEFNASNEVKSTAVKPAENAPSPVAVIEGSTAANAGQKVQLDASKSSDPKGYALDYAWQVTPKLDFETDGPLLSFVAPKVAADTHYHFTLHLNNGKKISTASHHVLVKATATAATCSPQWDTKKAYSQNDKVQHKGRQYMARWWTQGQEPGNPAYTGADGSGKAWKDLGPCSSTSSGSNTATPVPTMKISGTTLAKSGEQVTLSAPADKSLSYRWSVSPTLNFKASSEQLSFTAPTVTQDTSYRFKLEVSNGQQTVVQEHSVKIQAQPGTPSSTCQSPWSASASYLAGNKVSHKGNVYSARWWTQGNEPGNPAFTGDESSGKVWRNEGACK
ncbi:discoidin domain-containing protein [Ectopseudomonas mendocina]|uniref:Discoidin domain-containing protein n=1 Tax=Ectopseudomonas mendocina TaxID=300 RepID=A0ABZ2RLG7_ECTME